jgi:hypothetical protein
VGGRGLVAPSYPIQTYTNMLTAAQTRLAELEGAEESLESSIYAAASEGSADDPMFERAQKIYEQRDEMVTAAQEFSDSMTEIMESYYATYQSIYDGFYNASTLFTESMEATSYKGDDVRKTLEENTAFYREYGENLDYLLNGASLDGIDLTQLVSILQQMDTEQAAGITAMIAEEVKSAGATEGGETPGEVLQGWMDDLTEYSEAVGSVTEPMAKSLSGLQEALDEAFETYSTNGTDANVTKENVVSALGYTPLESAPVTSVNGKAGAVELAASDVGATKSRRRNKHIRNPPGETPAGNFFCKFYKIMLGILQ